MKGLNSLNSWAESTAFYAPRSAQGYLGSQRVMFSQSACGSACGTGDPQPSSCGAGDTNPKPSACGAGDSDVKPSACGATDEK